MATPPNIQQIFTEAGEATTGFSQGFSEMMKHLAEIEAGQSNDLLSLIGSPSQLPTDYQPLGDVLYGQTGYIPGSSLVQEGAGWQAAMSSLPGIFDAQSAQRAAEDNRRFSQELNAALASLRASSSSGGSSGGDDSGLTPYQAEQLSRNDRDFAWEQEKYLSELDRDMAEEAMQEEEAAREQQRMAAGMVQMLVTFGGMKPKEAIAFVNSQVGSGFENAAVSAATGAASDARDDANDARTRQQERRQDLRDAIAGYDLGSLPDGLTKQQVTDEILGRVRVQFPQLAGMAENRVRSIVNTQVNSQWPSYQAGADEPPKPGENRNRRWFQNELVDNMRTAFGDYTDSLPETENQATGETTPAQPTWKEAFDRVYNALRSDYGAGKEKMWRGGVKDKQVRRRITSFLKSQGLRAPDRPVRPGGGGGDLPYGAGTRTTRRPATRVQAPVAARNRAVTIRRMAAGKRTQAQKTFLRNYTKQYGTR